MVTLGRHDRRGTSSLGCLVSIILLVAAAVLRVQHRPGVLPLLPAAGRDETQAPLAPSLTNDVIYRRLAAKSDSLLGRTLRFEIRRSNRITIHTEYSDSVDLPFFKHTFNLKPKAEEPL